MQITLNLHLRVFFDWMTLTKLDLIPSKTEHLFWQVLYDKAFSFRQACSVCVYHIRDIQPIRKGLPLALAEQIVNWMIVIFYYIKNQKNTFQKLQCVQNCLARVGAHALVAPSL